MNIDKVLSILLH